MATGLHMDLEPSRACGMEQAIKANRRGLGYGG